MTADKSPDNEATRDFAMQIVSVRLRELAGNILRVVRGAGRSYEIGRQAQDLIEALHAYRDAVGQFPASEAIDAALHIETPDEQLNQMDDEQEMVVTARQAIIRGALQIAASRLLGQRTQEAVGYSEMLNGARDMEKLREERRQRSAAISRGALPPKGRL
jgi:hypothetical protein